MRRARRRCFRSPSSTWYTVAAQRALVDARAGGRVALRIEIDEQHAPLHRGEARREIDRRRRLADAALLVRDRDDARHRAAPSCHHDRDAARRRGPARRASASRPRAMSGGKLRDLLVADTRPSSRRAGRCGARCRALDCDERREIGERARDHDVERRCRARSPRRAPSRASTLASASSIAACCRNAPFLWLRVEQRRRATRAARSRAESPGTPPPLPTSSTRTTVVARQVRQHGERVEHVMRDHSLRLANRRQVVRAVPLARAARDTRRACRAAPCGSEARAPADGQRAEAVVDASIVADRRASCRLRGAIGAFAKPRFRCTSRSEIAAGVMPEMRAACPIVSGLCRLSFCCTSVEKPRTVR